MFQLKYGILLLIAGIWNMVFAALALVDIDQHVSIVFNYENTFDDPVARFYLAGFWLAIAAFGLGYAVVAWNQTRNRAFISIGVPGKILFFSAIAWLWWQGTASTIAITLASGDLLFAILFIWFLFRTREHGFV